MNVLVACHCKHTHDPVYLSGDITVRNPKYYNLYNPDELAEVKKVFGIAHIDYIEKRECALDNNQFRDWDKLPRKYDIIVSVHCPVYGCLHYDAEYKYIDFVRRFYKDIKNHIKPGGFFHLPYNLFHKSWKPVIKGTARKTQKKDLEMFIRHNSNKNIKKVFQDILANDKNLVNYKLEIIGYKNRSRIPFFIDTEKSGTWSKNYKSTFRHIVISFSPPTDTATKTNMKTNIKKTKNLKSIRKKISSKTKKRHIY